MAFFDLLECDFEWGGRFGKSKGLDCLGLAIEVRRRILPLANQLPDFADIYTMYDRDTIPHDEIYVQMLASPRADAVDIPTIGCLAVIEGERGAALGTFIGNFDRIQDAVILFGVKERPIIVPDFSLPNLIGYFSVN